MSRYWDTILVLHPGSSCKAGEEVGLQQIIKGLNEVLKDTPYQGKIALETMAGKGSELGKTFGRNQLFDFSL